MKEIVKLGLILLVICLVASVALATTNGVTAPLIAEQKAIKNEKARKDVLPAATTFEALDAETFSLLKETHDILDEVYVGSDANGLVGYVVKTGPSGYGGAVEVITGVDLSGMITGVRVGKHTETPGLGANATLPSYYEQYTGKEAQTIVVNKTQSSETEVQAIAGATITSKTVTDGVNVTGEVVKSLMAQ